MTSHQAAVDTIYGPDRPLLPPAAARTSLERLQGPIAITGGTGFVGSHLVDTLCAAGLRPRVLVRDAASPRWIAAVPVERVVGGLGDGEALEQLVDGAQTVIHLAGVLRGATDAEFMAGNRDGTANLVAAIRSRAAGARLVHVSSQAAAGPAEDAGRGVATSDPVRPISIYGRSKAAGEEVVRTSGGRWRILRPAAVYGPRDSDVFAFFRLAASGVLPIPSGERLLSVVHVADVVAAILAAATTEGEGDILHVGSSEPMSMDDMLRTIAAAGGVRARLVHIPAWVFKTAGTAASALRWMGLRRMPLSRDKAEEILARHWVLQTGPSLERLGLTDLVPFADGTEATWHWYRSAGWL